MMRTEIEDGMGFSGLVPTAEELRQERASAETYRRRIEDEITINALRALCHQQHEALKNLRDATFDTLHAHKSELECCSVTRKRVSEASAAIEKYNSVVSK